MSGALIIYFILVSSACHNAVCDVEKMRSHWEFLAIERSDSRAYCEVISIEVERLFADQPGNIRILCVDDDGGEA